MHKWVSSRDLEVQLYGLTQPLSLVRDEEEVNYPDP